MGKIILGILLLSCSILTPIHAQFQKATYDLLSEKDKNEVSTIAITKTPQTSQQVNKLKLKIVHENADYFYVKSTANQLNEYVKNGSLSHFIFEPFRPTPLADSVRAYHGVNEVHAGTDLRQGYTGADVIIGFIDTGIEFAHPDFKNIDGTTRVLRIWDQVETVGPRHPFYNYGVLWKSNHINQGVCTHRDGETHGTTVAGVATGNGLANGENKGVAPDANIIMIRYKGSGPSWSNNVADGIEYIFKVADSLGKKAVVNVSMGSYFGSHDGRDPATQRTLDLIRQKKGRIVVTACGNSANLGKYHVGSSLKNGQEKFTFFKNNPNTIFGNNKIFFDGYSSQDSMQFEFAIKAFSPNFRETASTRFRFISANMDGTIFDTLRNTAGQRIGTIEFSIFREGPNVNYSLLMRDVDSLDYNFGFFTKGNGRWDLWSGEGHGMNAIIETIPDVTVFPLANKYVFPDLEQTIVSGLTAHPEIISVGNIRNRHGFWNITGTYTTGNPTDSPGQISINSSKGPNREGNNKPDIVAKGDYTLVPGTYQFIADAPLKVAPGGVHIANGGTSMASPVVAAIAALYLERCGDGDQKGFMKLLKEKAKPNQFMSNLPNNSYGYGYAHAWDMLLAQEQLLDVIGPDALCANTILFTDPSQNLTNIIWDNNENGLSRTIDAIGDYQYTAINEFACRVESSVFQINSTGGTETVLLPIQIDVTNQKYFTSGAQHYVWTVNGNVIQNVSGSELSFYENGGAHFGIINCFGYNTNECGSYAGEITHGLSTQNLNENLKVYPNPTRTKLFISSDQEIISIDLVDGLGKTVGIDFQHDAIDVSHLARGVYLLKVNTKVNFSQTKIIIE